jgi:hypothetical protein
VISVTVMLRNCLRKLRDWFRHLCTRGRQMPEPSIEPSDNEGSLFPREEPPTPRTPGLNVNEWFPNAPRRSILFAQQFVDAALAYPGVTAERHGDGIEFRPNFVWIERVYTLHQGFKLSLKGDESEINQHLPDAGPGMWNYTRVRIDSDAKLAKAIACIPIAWRAR